MTSNFLTLTKVHLLGMTGINRVRYSEDGKEKRKAGLFIGLYAFVMILMIAFVCFYAVMFAENGMNDVIPALSFALASAITLIFSLIRGPHMLFAMKDYDMLMSMPVKKSDIVASRLITSYLVNLVFCAVVMIPCAIVYFIYGGFNVAALVYILIAFLLSPVIPLVVSNIIGTLITAATMNLRHKAIFQTALAMVALVGVMALSFLVSYTSGAGSVEISDATLDMLLKIYPPAWLLQQSIAGKGFWYLLVLIAASAVLSAAFIAVLARYYLKINSALLSRKSSGRFEAKQLRAGSAFKAMYKNEFARLLSSPSYMLNSTSGLLLLVILSVVSIFFNPFEYLSGIPEFDTATAEQMKFLIVPIVMFTVGITTSSAASLSLEGNRRWIPFSMPVSSFQILMAKAMMSLTLSGSAGIVCSFILTFSLQLSAVQAVLLFVSVIVYASFSALFGTYINTKFPKYDWTNETMVVKNSASVTISVFAGMIPPMLLLFLGFSLFETLVIPVLVLDGLALAVAIFSFIMLKKAKLCDR